MTTKKWYQSKLVMLGLVITGVFGSNWLWGWLGGQGVTPEQINAIEHIRPDVITAIDRIKGGESILTVLGTLLGPLIIIIRVWFTTSLIPQSIKK